MLSEEKDRHFICKENFCDNLRPTQIFKLSCVFMFNILYELEVAGQK